MTIQAGLSHIQTLRDYFNAIPVCGVDDDYVMRKLQLMVDIDQYIINIALDQGVYSNSKAAEAEEIRELGVSVIAEHTEELKRILVTHDWKAIARMGGKPLNNAWLLVQHSDHDPEFQGIILEEMKILNLDCTEHYAYLFDRVATNTGRAQCYGTQFTIEGQPCPIDDPEGLDERRRQVGLMSIDEYNEVMAKQLARANRPAP